MGTVWSENWDTHFSQLATLNQSLTIDISKIKAPLDNAILNWTNDVLMISEESSLVGTQKEACTHATTFLTHKYLSSKRMQTKVFHDCVSVEEKM